MVSTRTTPKSSILDDIHPITPAQTHEPPSLPLPAPLRRRSLRLASVPVPSPVTTRDSAVRVKGKGKRMLNDSECEGNESEKSEKGFLNLRSGKKLLKIVGPTPEDSPDDCHVDNEGGFNVTRKPLSREEKGKAVVEEAVEIKTKKSGVVLNHSAENEAVLERGGTVPEGSPDKRNVDDEGGYSLRSRLSREEKGKASVEVAVESKTEDSGVVLNHSTENEAVLNRGGTVLEGSPDKLHVDHEGGYSLPSSPLSREEKGKATVAVESKTENSGVVLNHSTVNAALENQEQSRKSKRRESGSGSGSGSKRNEHNQENAALRDQEQAREPRKRERRSSGSGPKRNMERFRDIARENASRFAHFAQEEVNDDPSYSEPEEEREIEDWPGPFSTAMKIIKDRELKSVQRGSESSQTTLLNSIKWVPKKDQGNVGARSSIPSLQELCLKILSKNVDAIASLDSVPDALRHQLSQLLCDSRKINNHFFELLVGGTPTEIRLRDCSWLTEDQFTKCFQMSDTANLMVLQLDQCGRCLPDYVVIATLARSPRQLPRLTSLSLRGACRLSDGGLRALVSSASALRSINLSQCSLLTSASIYILTESLKSLLKELYLDDCQAIDAALIVPALMELEHLEVLSVAGMETVCDEFVKDYIVARGHNMKELVLKDCVELTDSSIKVIAEHCPGLCVLDLTNLCKLTDLSIGYLTNGCRALHTLKLCRNAFSDEAIAAFVETTGESLKELSLNNIKKVGYHTTLSLASHAKNLHSLDLSWCRNLTDNALGLIVDSCLSLRLLKLFGCTQVTDVFLNGHSNLQIQIIGMKMSPVLQYVKVPDPHQAALNYSSVSVDLV